MEIKPSADKKYYSFTINYDSPQSKVLKKFELLKLRKKGLYIKAYDIMNAITAVLNVIT